MSKGQSCVYLSKQQTKNLKDFIYNSNIFTKAELDNMFSVLPNNYLEVMMSVLQTNYRRELNLDNSIDKGIIKDYIINKYNELNNKQGEDDIDYYTTGEVVSNEEVEELKSNNAGVFQSFIGNINNSLIQFRKAVFENAKKQGIEITDKKDSDFYKTITSLSDSIIKKLMKEGKVINITPNDKLSTNMAVQVTGDVITIIYNPLLVVRDADKFDAIISHELLHTVTASAVNNTQRNIANEEEQKFTQEIFDIVKELANKEDFYWDMGIDINSMRGKYKYIKEFIANVMSNEELRNHLSDIKYQEDNPDIAEEEKTSILNKVFKSIYNYVRSFYSKDTDKDLDQSYLEKLTEIIQSHIDTQPSNAFGTLSQYTEGTATSEYEKELQLILLNSPRDKEGRLLAPNSKPTNLTERQYAQVRTKAFKDWFGDWENNPSEASKVVDENGEPLVVYHGTDNYGFTIFDPKYSDDKISLFASSSKGIASTYTKFVPIIDKYFRNKLLNTNIIELIENDNWNEVNKIINNIYGFRPLLDFIHGMSDKEYYSKELKELLDYINNNNLSEEEAENEFNSLWDLQSKNYKKNAYSINIRRNEINIYDNYVHENSGPLVEQGVIFSGTKGDLIEAIKQEDKIYNLYLNLKNPLIIEGLTDEGITSNWNNLFFEDENGYRPGIIVDNKDLWGNKTRGTRLMQRTRDISKYAKDRGYDGVIFKNISDHGPYVNNYSGLTDMDEYMDTINDGVDLYDTLGRNRSDVFVSFNSNQIKSATDNIGTFSKDNNRIDRYTEGKVGDASSVKSNWAQKVNDNYEVSSKGDKRFSALNATFKKGTVIDGTDVGGMTIEDVYQSVIKKSGKNQPPSKDSKLYKSELKTKEEKEDFSYYEGYLPLWQEWVKQNPELIEDLREKAKGKTLTDQFANTRVNQARALADILNNGYSSKNTSIATKNYTKTTPSENPNTNFVFTDNAQAYTALHDVEGVEKSQFNSPKEGIKLNVTANSNQAGIRMKDDSTANSNAYGLVVKKNQQDNDGKFIHQEGTFKDTDEDFNMFVALNEHMFNRLEASDNKEIVFPSKIALGRAALPKRFAEWLQQQLKDRYGLDYDIVEHESNSKNEKYKYEGYGLKASNSNKDQSSTEKSQSPTRTPKNVSKNYYIKDKNLTITASSSEHYKPRTIDNIEQSDVTIALASDFKSLGEKLTKKEAESRNKYVSESIGEGSNKSAKEIAKSIFNQIKKLGIDTSKPLDLNIAGNGIYQEGMPSQEDVDTLITDILKELQKLGLQIKSVRSGGQTGVDEAGVKASLALGLPTILHGTKDFKFRREAKKDISDKIDQYLKRFNVSNEDIKGVIENKVEQSKKTTSVKTGKTREQQKKEREDKENAKKKRALESYNKEAPKLNLQIDKSKLDSVLINNIPNLAQRVALEKAVYHLFTNYWDLLLQEAKENSKNVDDGNLSKIYDYILTGTQEEQKLKLLNTLTYVRYEQVNGQQVGTQMNAITYLMHTILDDIINFSSVTYKDTKTNTRGQNVQETKVNTDIANQVINYYLVQLDNTGAIKYDNNGVPLFNRNNPFGESFYLRYIQNNLYLKKDLKGLAIEFVKNLSTQIQPITDVETFKAVFIKSQRLLKHNDSIKVNFLNKGVFNNKSQSNLEEPQEDDRSGLSLVKFKTMEPSKRMSQRVRRILSQTPRYLNGKIQFNTLGLVEYLTPDVAYYQLVDKFATIRNEQDYNRLVESLSEEYPWFQFIKEKIDQDEIFRNDFYTAFRNVFNRYAIINNSGKVSYLNGEAAINILLDDTQSIYESGLLLNKYSIYNSDTTPNMTNIQKFRDNVLKGVLQNFSNNLKSIKDAKGKITNNTPQQLATLLKQLLVLSDYKIDDKKVFDSEVSLKSILNTFGVSTDKIDLSHLYTTIEEIEQYINNREDFKNNPIDLKSLINEEDNKDKDNKDKEAALLNAIEDTENLASVLIDYFTQKGVESKNNKLANMIDAMGKIVSKNTGFSSSNKNLIQSFYKQYLRILSPLKDTTEIYGTTTFQFDNNSRPSYSTPSYASDILRHLNSINTQEDLDNFRQWVDTEFTTYDFYKDDNGECNHLWIKTLLDYIGKKGEEKSIQEIKEFARNFDATEILGVGGSDEKKNSVGKVSNYTLLNSLIPAAYNATSTDPNYQFGYFRNPLYSDKDVLVLFKAPMFKGDRFEERVIDQLYKVWKSEYNRILFYTRREQFKNKINQIEGLETTGTKFHFFPEFNNDLFWEHLNNSTDTKSFVKEQIRELLESKFEAFYNEAYSKAGATKILNIIDRNSKKEENEGEILFESEEDSTKEDVELSKEEKEEKENEQFRLLYKQFYYNDFMNYIESIRLFQGDPALYGNSTALVKRGAQSHVFGQRGYFIDENGEPITERCMYMEDYYADSNSMASVMELLKQDTEIFSDLDKGMIEGLIRKTANYYKGICTTDGQSFRTLKSIKKILKGFGKLTPEVEESLNNIESKKMGSMDIVNIINALKPFLYSSERRDLKAGSADDYIERVEKVTTQHKNSEYALSALYSVLNSVLNRSNTLKGLQQFMEKNDIDVVHFKSVVKVGANNLFDLNNVYNPKLKEALGKRDNYTVSNNGKIIFPLKIQLGKDNIEEVKIEIPLEAYNKNEDAVYEYIRDFLKINPNRDSSLSKDELNKKQELYNAFQRQYGLESLSQEQLYKVLNYQFHSDEEGNYLPEHPNLNKIHTFKLQDYVIVQPVDDHYLDHEAIFGSQLRNIVPANLPDNFTCTLRIKGKEVQLNKEQTIELYNTLITDQLLDSYNEDLRKKFNSIKEFKKYIDDLVASNDKYGEDIYNALQLDESGTDFRMPLTSSNLSNKIDEIILSAAKNAIQRQKIKGGNIVLVSNFGFTNTLKTKTETVEVINDKGEKEERQRIKYIPCYAPMSMMQIYQDYLEEESDSKGNTWYTINFEKLKKSKNIDPKFLDMVGYRIPTENNYSIMPIRIVGILPQSMGSSIMLPQDIITMSGTDFKQYWSL